ncbi:hypothetical protein CN514_05985 [Bacillus sp. AFS001701]|uniref:hypothetical protein n=1 Tax=Bacillaceae TaxID=186817 RepID=UPI000BF4B623|nr:hypothetical protein [Bacillus sp. AFS001701]PET71775.1 hypothetical protein CN514_05985 [Bacillus sp. AFS001701]
MSREKAIQIPLEVWQNPQGDVILNISERDCHVFFGCWDEDSNPADYIAKVTFNNCWSANYIHSEYVDYEYELKNHRSYILKVLNSRWLEELYTKQLRLYSRSKINKDYNHYVVRGHDVCVEVIAREFIIEKLNKEQAGENFRLSEEA